MIRNLALAVSGLCASLAGGPLVAQAPAPVVLDLPASTEALGLGTVFPVSGRDSDALFYNAGVLADARGIGVAAQRIASSGTLLTASGAASWGGGGVGVGVQSLAYDARMGTPPDASDLSSRGELAVAELVASVGYGRVLGPIRAGAVGKLVEARIGGTRASGLALDLGIATELAFGTVGLAVQNLGPELELGTFDMPMPDRVTLAGSFEPVPFGPLDVRAAAAVSRRTDGEVAPGVGLDVRYWPVEGRTFIGRVGARRVPDGSALPVTFGLAFWGDALALEYAFQAHRAADDAHRLGVRWRR